MQDVTKYFDKKSSAVEWSIYFNALEGYKISWPTQRWLMREIEGVLPLPSYVYASVQLRFKLTPPKVVPNALDPTIMLFHNLAVTIDRHGSLDMETYVKAALDNLSVALQCISAEFREERSAHRVETDNAIVAGRLEYKPPDNNTSQAGNISDKSRSNTPDKETSSVSLWKLIRIIRSGDRMYTLTGTLVESAGMEEVAYKDMVGIMNTFSSLKRQ